MTPDFFTRIGGEAAVRQLVGDFYNLMDKPDEAQRIRLLHSEQLTNHATKYLCSSVAGSAGRNWLLRNLASLGCVSDI